MMKIVFTHPKGMTAIMTPAPQADVARHLPEVKTMTELEYVQFIRDRDVPPGSTNISIVNDFDIPNEAGFRDALNHDLSYDKNKAVAITKKRLEEDSRKALEVLDRQYKKALSRGTPTEGILNAIAHIDDIINSPAPTMTLAQLRNIKIPR